MNPKIVAISGLVLAPLGALAVGPSNQTSPSPQAIVQMRPNGEELATTATGSVIRKFTDASGDGWLCVLTTDHVAAAGYTGISFGDGNPASNFRGGPDTIVRRAPLSGADLAVVGIRYGTPDSFFHALTPLQLLASDPNARVGTTFTQFGYGFTGELDNSLSTMHTVARAGISGFQNNRIERVRNFGSAFTPYSYAALEWDFNDPSSAGAVFGEGSTFNGDSGSPYLIQSLSYVSLLDGSTMPVFTQGIMAVHAYGDGSASHGWLGSGDHIPGGGVAITQDVAQWIDAQCLAVPTPGAFALVFASMFVRGRSVRRE
jgi:hypothetical protein